MDWGAVSKEMGDRTRNQCKTIFRIGMRLAQRQNRVWDATQQLVLADIVWRTGKKWALISRQFYDGKSSANALLVQHARTQKTLAGMKALSERSLEGDGAWSTEGVRHVIFCYLLASLTQRRQSCSERVDEAVSRMLQEIVEQGLPETVLGLMVQIAGEMKAEQVVERTMRD